MIQLSDAKSILTKYKTADSWFRIKYSMNLYRGCQHGCIYCDTRSKCYNIDFSKIIVKQNAPALLRAELKKITAKDVIGTGSMNDPYMPVEQDFKLTRTALEIINEFRFPVHIITKSNLVLRDTDLIKEISRTRAIVSLTITTADDEVSGKIEPGAPVSSERFNTIKTLRKNNIECGVTLMPVLPFLTDTRENISGIIEKAAEAGASYIIPAFGVTLRDIQRDFYFENVSNLFPEKYPLIKNKYKGGYEFGSPNYKELKNIFYELCTKHNIPSQIAPFTAPEEQFSLF